MTKLNTIPYMPGLPVTDLSGLTGGSKKKTSSKKKSSHRSSGPTAPQMTDEEIIKSNTANLYTAYQPEEITYAKTPEETLRSNIVSWLRPGYDLAIKNRQTKTKQYHAELDADAISRGMGASTYVTDVKSRQNTDEADDIQAYESDYGAQLAKYLSEAIEKENDRAFETKVTNTERSHEAYMTAYSAALQLFQAYKQGNPGQIVTSTTNLKSLSDCETYVSGLSVDERKKLFDGADGSSLASRNQMITNIGAANFLYLQQKYPVS